MSEIYEAGYKSQRRLALSKWTLIKVVDGNGDEVLSLNSSDPRVTWTGNENSQELSLEVVLSGSDSDISNGVIVAGVELYDVDDTNSPVAGASSSSFEFESEEDTIRYTIKIQIPQV